MLENFEDLNSTGCVSVKHMMSLFSNLLSGSKSIACLLKDLILNKVTTNELMSISSILGGNNMHSKRSLLYSSKAWGLALIDFTLNDPSIYNPSSEVTLLKAT